MLVSEIILLEQKQFKTIDDLEKEQRLQGEIKRNISHLQQRLATLCATLATKSNQRQHIDEDLLFEQTTFIKSLKVNN